jgi:hypothetical protein
MVIRSIALEKLWGITNILQLFFLTPLLAISTPANVMLVYGIIVGAVNFEYLDLDGFLKDSFHLEQDQNSYGLNFDLLGYDSMNYVIVMGPLIFVLGIVIFITAIMIVLWKPA